MNNRFALVCGATAGMLAVILGAFGAHALHTPLQEAGLLNTYKTAVEYQFYHALALLAIGIWANSYPSALLRYAAGCMAGGIILFSGSLYVICLTHIRSLGMITPLGGVLFIAGWVFVLIAATKKKAS